MRAIGLRFFMEPAAPVRRNPGSGSAAMWQAAMTVFAVLALCAAPAAAQSYPRRTVTIVVPYSPGAATDILARAAAQRLSDIMGQQFIVLNRDGATGAIGTEFVAKSAPDGYTLLWGSSGPLTISPNINAKLPYDPLRDFAPISVFSLIPYVLVVHPSVPVKSLKELIAFAKARPGKLTYPSSGTGSAPHLASELLKSMAGIDLLHVPYKGTALFMTDLISGQVDVAFTGIASSLGYIKAGRLVPLAVTGPKRSDLLPNMPTMPEAGLPGYEVVVFYSLLAPAGTPKEITTALNAALHKSLEHPDIKTRIANEGAYPAGSTPEQFAAFLKTEIAKYAKVIKDAGIKAN